MKELTCREKIHIVISINGCISRKAIKILSGSEGYKRKVIFELRQKNLIERKKGGLIRMTRDGVVNTWRDHIPEQYVKMAENTRATCIKATGAEERRMMYQSEVLAMVLESGAGLWEKEGMPPKGEIAYVRAKNLKKGYTGDRQAINQCRVQGTLFGAGDRVLNVYAMGGGTLKWIHDSETRYKVWTENENLRRIGKMKESEGVLVIEEVGNLKRFMGEKNQRGGPIQEGDVYKHMYVLPKDETGTFLLGILALGRGKKETEGLAKEKGGANFLLPDLTELRKIKLSGVKQVCCLEEMGEGVRSVVPDAKIIEVSREELVDSIFSDTKLTGSEGTDV